MTSDAPRIVRFGLFELDLQAGELARQGRPVRLQQQPFLVLRALIERPGEAVTREDLRRAVWPDGITVDFDQSLNKSVTKLRDALGDSVTSPRFIETLPKRGYRFIAPVSAVAADRGGAGASRGETSAREPVPTVLPDVSSTGSPTVVAHASSRSRRSHVELIFSVLGLATIGAMLMV